ncbi:MAG: hypothetical protein FJZ56_07290 [Chlamydiae bacterium]|nr:hypothetical protein [Chlamydiota bacterium]
MSYKDDLWDMLTPEQQDALEELQEELEQEIIAEIKKELTDYWDSLSTTEKEEVAVAFLIILYRIYFFLIYE